MRIWDIFETDIGYRDGLVAPKGHISGSLVENVDDVDVYLLLENIQPKRVKEKEENYERVKICKGKWEEKATLKREEIGVIKLLAECIRALLMIRVTMT